MKQKWAVLILILVGIAAYANTAKNGLFWDDDEFITRNAYIRSFRYLPQWFSRPMTAGAGVNSNYYRPLLTMSFAIDYKLWKLWPVGYHLENMFWHIAAGITLFVFLSMLISVVSSAAERPGSLDSSARRKLLARNDGGTGNIIAFAASLLWLIHPVHVEAVTYANSRGDSMATAFILLSLILWLRQRFWASAAAFVLALLSKEFAIVTPGLIALVEFIKVRPWRPPLLISRLLRELFVHSSRGVFRRTSTPRSDLLRLSKKFVPFFMIATIYILLRLTVLNFQNTLNFYGSNSTRSNLCEPQRLDLCNPLELYATSLPVRLMTFSKVLPIYGSILVWPNDLHMERTVEIPAAADQTVIISAAAVIVILLYCYIAVRKNRVIIPFAIGWFLISILPVSGLIPISQILAEHFLYLPSIGFFVIISWVIMNLFYLSSRAKERTLSPAAKCYVPKPRDPATKESDIDIADARFLDSSRRASGLARNDEKHNWANYLSLTFTLLLTILLVIKTIRQNRIWRDPITFYEYTLSHAKPTARVYNNLAMAHADKKQREKAIENYLAAIAMGDVYPNPHYNLGNTLVELGKLDEAEKEYQRALEIDPNFHYATLKLGQMYIDKGKIDDAKKLVCPVFPTQPLCRQF